MPPCWTFSAAGSAPGYRARVIAQSPLQLAFLITAGLIAGAVRVVVVVMGAPFVRPAGCPPFLWSHPQLRTAGLREDTSRKISSAATVGAVGERAAKKRRRSKDAGPAARRETDS